MKRSTVTLSSLAAVLTAISLTLPVVQAARRESTSTNKAIVRQAFEEAWNQGNVDALDKYVAADYVEHQTLPGFPPTREGLKQFLASLRRAFPDLHITLDDVLAEGDKVVVRSTARGTQKGDFMGIAPTGKQFTMTAIDIIRMHGGKGVEHWGNEDDLGLMQQLGAIPPAAAPAAPANP